MNRIYAYIACFLMAAASLSSCSKSHYAFQPNQPSYSGEQVRKSEAVVAKAEPVASEAAVVAKPAAVVASKKMVSTVSAPAPVVAKAEAKPSLVQRAVIAKVTKQIDKKLSTYQGRKHQEAAEAQSKAGRAAIVAGVGLLLLLLGGAAEIGIVALIGLIAFLVGVVMLFVALISGN